MRRGEIDTKLNKNIAEFPSILLGTSPAVGIVLWAVALGVLAASLYLAPTITALALAAFGLGLPLFLLAWSRPEFGLLALIFLTSSFIPADILDTRLPIGGGLDLRDIVLIGMLGLLGFRGLARKTLPVPWWPVGAPLLVFLGFALFSTCYALFFQNVEFNWVFSEARILMFYCVFFVTGWTITDRRQLVTVLVGLFILADLIAGVLILQQSLGTDHPLLAAMSYSNWRMYDMQQTSGAGGFGMVRIMPPGVTLPYFMMILAFCLMVFTARSRFLRIIFAFQFVYLNVGLLLTYTRALWIATAVALGLVLIFLLPRYKAHLIRYLVIGISVLLLLLAALGAEPKGNISSTVVSPFAQRFLSILEPEETMATNSLQGRIFETEEGLRSVSEHPLVGVGLGNAYREVTTFQGEAAGWRTGSLAAGEISRFTRFIHNSYLYIAVKMGLPALVCFLWFCGMFVVKSGQLYMDLSGEWPQAIVLAVVAGFLGLMLWSIFHQHFVQTESTAIVGLVAGLVAGIRCIHGSGLASHRGHRGGP